MKKEVLIAIIVGFGIGLAITFAIYQAQRAYVKETINANQEVEVLTPTPTPPQNVHQLDLLTPEDATLSEIETIFVNGFTSPDSYVTIVSNSDTVITRANASGSFMSEFPLSEGVTTIKVTALNELGVDVSKEVHVSYFPKKATETQEEEDE